MDASLAHKFMVVLEPFYSLFRSHAFIPNSRAEVTLQ